MRHQECREGVKQTPKKNSAGQEKKGTSCQAKPPQYLHKNQAMKERWRQGEKKTHQEGAREARWTLLSQYSTLEQWSALISGNISQLVASMVAKLF
uniref:Uncharacterized protein n=1 Tax=Arundo donax TaxID=35708 RepID=A0A0A9CS94_ARUDO